MKRLIVLALFGLVTAGCFTNAPAPPSAEQAECEAGVADAYAALGAARVAAPVFCSTQVTRGFYDVRTNTAYLSLREPYDRHAYAADAVHELGHAWDRWAGVPSASTRYKQIRGLPLGSWPFEDYADVFTRLLFDPKYIGYGGSIVTAHERSMLCGELLVPCTVTS